MKHVRVCDCYYNTPPLTKKQNKHKAMFPVIAPKQIK